MPLTQLTTTQAERLSEYRKRNRAYDEKIVTPGAVVDFEPQGWVVSKKLQAAVRLRRDRQADQILENRFWCCLYRLGYPELNISRNFQIPLSSAQGAVSKQIDVFAKDDETIVIAECKTAEDYKRKSVQKDLGEFHANKKFIADSIRNHYGKGFRPKIIWLFVISNMALTQSDISRAQEYQISIVTERELVYFEELSKALEGAARQQFKAEYLSGQQVPALENKKIPASRIKLGGKAALVFTAKASDVLKRAFVNHRDLRDPSSAPTYQRLVKPNRLGKIASFLEGGGFFPNSILLSFQKKPRFDIAFPSEDRDTSFGYLYLPNSYKSIKVVDGQHRLYGCAVLSDETKEPSLVFVAFENISGGDEASLFAVINKEQQRVQKKLLDDLEGDLKWDSPNLVERIGAIASRAVDLLNAKFGSPFEDKVISPGLKASDDRPLTLPEVKKALVSAGLVGKVSTQGAIISGPFLVISKGEVDSKATLDRLVDGLGLYFDLVRGANPERWDAGREGRVCNNFGVPGHLRLLGEIARHIERRDGFVAGEVDLRQLCDEIRNIAQPVLTFLTHASNEDIEKRFNVKLGSGGVRQYYFSLSEIVNEEIPEFQPTGFKDWKSEINKEAQEKADQDVRWIQSKVHAFVVQKLQEVYGDKYFETAINSKEIKIRAIRRRMSAEVGGSAAGPEKYLEFSDLKKIVEQKENWPHFENELGIKLPSQTKSAAKYILWFDEVERMRLISERPYQKAYSEADVLILEHIIKQLSNI